MASFKEFWDVYPRKVGRKEANRIFDKIVSHIDFDVLLSGVMHYRDYCKITERPQRYIKHASTWLNQECWDDDYSEEINELSGNRDSGRERILDAVSRTLSRNNEHSTPQVIPFIAAKNKTVS